jgi:hypothetical protein
LERGGEHDEALELAYLLEERSRKRKQSIEEVTEIFVKNLNPDYARSATEDVLKTLHQRHERFEPIQPAETSSAAALEASPCPDAGIHQLVFKLPRDSVGDWSGLRLPRLHALTISAGGPVGLQSVTCRETVGVLPRGARGGPSCR